MEGQRLRDEGLVRVDEKTHPAWKYAADRAIIDLARKGEPFSAEDVTAIAGRPARPNAVGARMSAAARRGIIAPVGYKQAHRSERHSSRMLRWVGTEAAATAQPPVPLVDPRRYMRPNNQAGRPDRYVDLSKSAAMSVDQTRAQRAKAEEEERRRTPLIAPGLLRVRFGDSICRSCRGTGGNLIERCLRCNGLGIEP